MSFFGAAKRHCPQFGLLNSINRHLGEMIPGFATRLDGSSVKTHFQRQHACTKDEPDVKALTASKSQCGPWERNHEKWQKKTLLPVINISWLTKGENGCLGCVVCKLAKKQNEYGWFEIKEQGVNFSNVKRHQTSEQHLEALADLGLISELNDDKLPAPSIESFQRVAKGRLKGPIALQHGEAEVGGRKKITCMLRCLSEAMFQLDRKFLASAGTITLHMDVRQLKLLVRFRASNKDLEWKKGILGIAELPRTTSTCLEEGLKGILRTFCTSPFNAGEVDQALYANILRCTEILDMDAAADEQCSARELRKDLLTSVKVVMKDKAHASRRVLSRPWNVIPALDEAWSMFVGDSSSVVRMIQKSDVLSKKFHEYCQAANSAPVSSKHIKNLQFKKQRFDSVAKPLGRGILFFEALLATAIWATVHLRGSDACKDAEAFLTWIDERRMILLAMAADCADSALGLVRSFDSEQSDPANTMLESERFLSELHYMFNQGSVLRAEGYTKHMLEQLQRPRGFLLKSEPKSIGGPGKITHALLAECLAQMRLYTSLALEVVNSEFPQFEIISSFRLFDLAGRSDPAKVMEQANRLCQVFQVSNNDFLQQFWDHQAVAMNELTAHGLSNADAWVTAVKKTSSRSSIRKNHPSDALTSILMRYLAHHGCCTSGVEQAFSKLQNQFPAARDHMSSDLYLAESKIVIDWQDSQAESIFAVAQQCWTLWFGKPRASCSTRLDSGVPRKRLDGSEASFAAKRHKHMHEIETVLPSMVRASTESQGMPILMDAEKEKIEKEINFQKSKHMRSQLEAYLDGVLLENEIPEGLREAAVSFRQKQTANSDQRKANEARLISVMTPQPPDVNFASAKLFLQDPVWAQKLPRTLSFVADVWRADVWVVTDPANPDLAVIWHAALKGGHVVSLDFVCTKGAAGISFTYGAAVRTKRSVFVDPDFANQFPEVASAVRRVANMPHSKWKLLASWQEFARSTDMVAGSHLPVRHRRDMEVIALTTERIATALNRKNACTKEKFFMAIVRVACSKRQICGT